MNSKRSQTLQISLVIGALALPTQATLIAHYNMEQSSSPIIDQVGGETAEATGIGHAYSVPGPTGWGDAAGLSANGSWQLDTTESAGLRALANDITVAAWVNIEDGRFGKAYGFEGNDRFDRIIGDDAEWDADGWAFGIENQDATTDERRLLFTKNGVADVYSASTLTITEGTWIHLAATVSSTTGVSFYINGTLLGTNGNTANIITTNGHNGLPDPYGIGRAYGSGANGQQWFAGDIDEVRVYDTVLTQPEIAALATLGAASLNLAITEVGGGVWELTLAGAPDTRYEFRSSTDLVFNPGILVQGLTQGNPGTDPGTISGPSNEFVTTDGNGDAVVRVTLTGPRNFIRGQDGGPLVRFDFEADGQGFTPSGDWAWGVAASDNGLTGGQVTGGYGSNTGHCWATMLGNGGPAINGGITATTDSILTSPDIDLTGITDARLTFAAAVDAASGDTLEVRVRDADDDSLLGTLTPFSTFPANTAWQNLDLALPATANLNTIYLEFRFQGANANYLGFYLDNVAVTY
jgi:hypothetical protein